MTAGGVGHSKMIKVNCLANCVFHEHFLLHFQLLNSLDPSGQQVTDPIFTASQPQEQTTKAIPLHPSQTRIY